MKQNKQQNGLYIPTGLAAETTLNWNEKAIYSIYHYFTFYGEKSTCCITVECIAQRLGIGEQVVRRAKKHLKELEYINTDGGIKTTALKHFSDPIKNDTPNPIKIDSPDPIKNDTPNPIKNDTPTLSKLIGDPIKIDTPNPIKIDRHNKETNKKNKDINLESMNEKPLNNESVKESETNLKPSSNSNDMEFDELLNTPSPKDIADAKRERVENISKRFFQSVERHTQQHTQPLQSDINKIAQRLDEIDCKEARQLKRIMNDVLKNSFNGLEVYLYPTTTPSNVSATASVAGGAYGDLPF